MKIKKTMYLLVTILVVALGFTSCSNNDEDEGKGSLIGTWSGVVKEGSKTEYFFRFAENGDWFSWNTNGGDENSKEGTYQYSEKENTIYLRYISNEPIWGNEWEVAKLTSTKLTINVVDEKGKTVYQITLKRVK